LVGEGDRLVADVDAGDARALPRQRQRVLSGVALQMEQGASAQLAEQLELLGKQRRPAGAQEAGLIALVGVVRRSGGVPAAPVLPTLRNSSSAFCSCLR